MKRKDRHSHQNLKTPKDAAAHHPEAKSGGEENTDRYVYLESVAILDITEELKKQHERERGEDARHQKKQLIWTIIAAGIVFLYTAAAFWQGCSSQKSAKAALDAVDAARAANALTVEATRGRLLVTSDGFVSPPEPGEGITARYLIQNVGKSTAFYGIEEGNQIWMTFPDGDMPLPDPTASIPLEPGYPAIQQLTGTTLPLQQGFLNNLPTPREGIAPPTWPTIYFFGKLIYQSIGPAREIQFCSYLARSDEVSRALGYHAPSVGGKYVQMSCPRWNSETILGK